MISANVRPATYSITMKYVVSIGAPVVDGDDVGVGQVGGRLGLAPEPLDERGVGRELGEHDLDGHRSIERGVLSDEHLGHPAPGQLALHLVALGDDHLTRGLTRGLALGGRRGVGSLVRHAREG